MEDDETKIELPAMRPSRSKVIADAETVAGPDESDTDRIIREFNSLPSDIRTSIIEKCVPAKSKKRTAQPDPVPADPVKKTKQVHWKELYPDAAAIDPETGEPRKERARTGGQFSLKQLTIQNKFTKETRKAVMHTGAVVSDFPIKKFEQVIDEVEVLFDFEDERDEMMQAFGCHIHDPLRLNDTGSAFEHQIGKISPPPL